MKHIFDVIAIMTTVFATTFAGFANAGEAVRIDKTNMTEQIDYEVHFCYRPSPKFLGIPGHAYVAFWSQDSETKNVTFRAFGATSSGITGIFNGDGYLSPEYQDNVDSDCLVVIVNSPLYNSAWSIAKPLFGEPEYSFWNYGLLNSSCVDYARNIASALSLTLNDSELPNEFIELLKSQNS